ncbi:MAG: NUDIX hydrolase [Candidatus Kerfeldbacteria bacterium]|nr:NUDIX hydrolase [Candidatus Kerfeldbacteria bacterium]
MKKWKVLSEELVNKRQFRPTAKVRCRLPNGRIGTFYLRVTGALVCALVLTKRRMVVLAQQYRLGPDAVLGELPGGIADDGETPRCAIVREVLEETGYRGRVQFLGRSFVSAWVRGVRYHFLITDAAKVQDPQNDDYEMSEPILVSIAELKHRLKKGLMTDCETAYRGLEQIGR